MKKGFCATVAAVLMGVFVYANNGTDRNKTDKEKKEVRREKREERRAAWIHSVGAMTAAQFYYDFPGAKDIIWKEGHFSEATFNDGDTRKTAYYDSDNTLVGTTTEVGFSSLPAKAQQFITTRYPEYTVGKVILFDDNEANDTDMFLFDNSFEDEDNYFPVLINGTKQVILKVTMNGDVSFLQNYK